MTDSAVFLRESRPAVQATLDYQTALDLHNFLSRVESANTHDLVTFLKPYLSYALIDFNKLLHRLFCEANPPCREIDR